MGEVEDLGGDISSLKDEDSAVINKTKTTSTNPPYSGDLPASGLTPAEKRLRALKKKLQQIENLKEKMEHGETLEKTQVRALSFLNANTKSKQVTLIDRKDVGGMSEEIPCWWRVTVQIWVVLLIGRAAREICFNQSEGISLGFSETVHLPLP